MSFVLSVLRKELIRLAADKTSVLLWIGLPLVIGGLITLSMGGSGGPQPRAKVLVVDRDDSFLSQLIARALSGEGVDAPVDAELVEEEAGRARIDAGEASALLIVPEGFGEALFDESPTRLELITNPAQRILPGIVEGMLELLSDATFYVHRVFGDELAEIRSRVDEEIEPTDLEVAAMAVGIRRSIEDLDRYLFPPAIELTVGSAEEEDEEDDTPINIAVLFLPGMVLMALVFAAQGLSEDLWQERTQGTLRRLRASPRSMASFFAGKSLAALLAMTGVAAVVLVIGFLYHGLSWSRLPLAVLFCGVSGLMIYLIMVPLQVLVSSQRAGSILSNAVIFPMLMVGGSFFPFAAIPDWMATLGRWTPNGKSVTILEAWITEGSTSGVLGTAVFFLLLAAALFFMTLPRLGGRFAGVS